MTTIKSALKESNEILKNAGVPSHALDSNLLLSYVLGISKEEIFCYPMRQISEDEVLKFQELVNRRAAREPMAHILGEREFWGMNFKVNKDTLDPRPDSECLVQQVLDIYKDKDKPKNIADFGTGTGCLLLTILNQFEESQGVGVDVSEAALEVAKENSLKLGLAKRASFVVSNWSKNVKGKFDLIISNPPYIKKSDIEGLEPEVSKYEPKLALDGGETGLECYIKLAPCIFSLLNEGGFAVLEYGIGQESDIKSIFESNGFEFVCYSKDLAGINRCITVQKIISA